MLQHICWDWFTIELVLPWGNYSVQVNHWPKPEIWRAWKQISTILKRRGSYEMLSGPTLSTVWNGSTVTYLVREGKKGNNSIHCIMNLSIIHHPFIYPSKRCIEYISCKVLGIRKMGPWSERTCSIVEEIDENAIKTQKNMFFYWSLTRSSVQN